MDAIPTWGITQSHSEGYASAWCCSHRWVIDAQLIRPSSQPCQASADAPRSTRSRASVHCSNPKNAQSQMKQIESIHTNPLVERYAMLRCSPCSVCWDPPSELPHPQAPCAFISMIQLPVSPWLSPGCHLPRRDVWSSPHPRRTSRSWAYATPEAACGSQASAQPPCP